MIIQAGWKSEASVLVGSAYGAGATPHLDWTIEIAGISVRCATVSGLGNARQLIERLKAGKAHYDFVQVMVCPGGCVGGGGQPISAEDKELAGVRGERLYQLDRVSPMRFPRYRPCTPSFWAPPSVRKRRRCSIPITRAGICPVRNK